MRHPLVERAAAGYPTAVGGKKRESGSTTFENARNFPATFTFHLAIQKTKVPIFCICRNFHTIRESMFSVANIMPVIIPAVSKYLSEQSTPIAKESGGAKNAKMI